MIFGFLLFPDLEELDLVGPWEMISILEDLRNLGDVDVVEERYVIDGNLWIASGVSAGMDLALAFIKHEAGEDIAGRVQSFAEYYPTGKMYGSFHEDSQAPEYLRKKR